MSTFKKYAFALLACFVAAAVRAEDVDPVPAAVTAIQGVLTGYLGLAVVAVIACITAGLGIWGIMFLVRLIKGGAKAGAGR